MNRFKQPEFIAKQDAFINSAMSDGVEAARMILAGEWNSGDPVFGEFGDSSAYWTAHANSIEDDTECGELTEAARTKILEAFFKIEPEWLVVDNPFANYHTPSYFDDDDPPEPDENTALSGALQRNDLRLAKRLLKCNPKVPNLINFYSEYAHTKEAHQLLIDHDANILTAKDFINTTISGHAALYFDLLPPNTIHAERHDLITLGAECFESENEDDWLVFIKQFADSLAKQKYQSVAVENIFSTKKIEKTFALISTPEYDKPDSHTIYERIAFLLLIKNAWQLSSSYFNIPQSAHMYIQIEGEKNGLIKIMKFVEQNNLNLPLVDLNANMTQMYSEPKKIGHEF